MENVLLYGKPDILSDLLEKYEDSLLHNVQQKS